MHLDSQLSSSYAESVQGTRLHGSGNPVHSPDAAIRACVSASAGREGSHQLAPPTYQAQIPTMLVCQSLYLSVRNAMAAEMQKIYCWHLQPHVQDSTRLLEYIFVPGKYPLIHKSSKSSFTLNITHNLRHVCSLHNHSFVHRWQRCRGREQHFFGRA